MIFHSVRFHLHLICPLLFTLLRALVPFSPSTPCHATTRHLAIARSMLAKRMLAILNALARIMVGRFARRRGIRRTVVERMLAILSTTLIPCWFLIWWRTLPQWFGVQARGLVGCHRTFVERMLAILSATSVLFRCRRQWRTLPRLSCIGARGLGCLQTFVERMLAILLTTSVLFL